MFRIVLKLIFFLVYVNAMVLHAMASTKKSNVDNIRFFSLKLLHFKEIFLSENFLLKMASMKLAAITSSG